MFINETYSDLPKSQCEKCKNNDICKWQNEVVEINTSISNLAFSKELPIEIRVDCKRFEKQETTLEFY